MRWARRLLIAASVIVAILVVTIAFLFLVDLGRFKGTVESVVSDVTGRPFAITGQLEASLGSTFDLVAEDVTLGNAEWGTAENVLELERVVISVDTWSLISGPIEVLNLEVEGLDIYVERNPETLRHSWSFKDKPKRAPGTPRKRLELPLWLHEAQLENIRVIYGQGWLDAPRTVSVSAGEFFADESDLLRMTIDGAVDDKPLSGTGMVGPLRALLDGYGPRWELEVSIGQFLAATEGTFVDLFRAQGPTIHAVMRGPAAERTLARLGLPPLATGPVDIEANLDTVRDGLRLVVDGAIGDLQSDIVARPESFKTIRDLDLSMDIRGPNLQAVGALLGANFLPATGFAVKGDVTGRTNDLDLDSVVLTAGDARLEIDGKLAAPSVDPDAEVRMAASGPEIRDFLPVALHERVPSGTFEIHGTATGDPGLIQIRDLTARLNDFELTAAGAVPVGSGMAGLDLAVNARGPDFEQVVEPWFEADVIAEPYSIDARIRNDGDGYIVDDLEFEIANAYVR
ncbi:MAG: AsmA family protein, partial [Gammaproteobacteria bacterium]